MFARGPIAPHPEHITTMNCFCSSPKVTTVNLWLAQKGQGRSLIRGIGLALAEDKRSSRKVLAASTAGPTGGRPKGYAVSDVRNTPSCTSFESSFVATTRV